MNVFVTFVRGQVITCSRLMTESGRFVATVMTPSLEVKKNDNEIFKIFDAE